MIQILDGFPDNVVACAAVGRVTKADYDDVLVPAVERALGRSEKIRCYYEVGSEFSGFDPGALWADAKVGLEHLARWERVAFVTDVEWLTLAANAFRFLMPGNVRVFSMSQAAEAKAWVRA